MLEKATVTMPYKELKELVDKNKEYEDKLGKIKNIETMTEEQFETDPFKNGLDEMFDLLDFYGIKHFDYWDGRYVH